MGETRSSSTAASPKVPTTPSPPPLPPHPLAFCQPSRKKKQKPVKVFRLVRSVFQSFPNVATQCKLMHLSLALPEGRHHVTGTRVTGTLYGHRKGKVSLSIQENPKCHPMLVVELPMHTNVFQKELSSGMVRIALECEKRPEKDKVKLLDEPMWTMYCNGKKNGYGAKREMTRTDVNVLELINPVSMGAGVIPGKSEADGPDNELAYMRAYFDRVVGSKDSETLYMLSPEGNNGPELSIFFVRL